MKAVVIYESMFGNTHAVADAIGAGLQRAYDVTVAPIQAVTPHTLADADLIVVGAPTHVHGLTRPSTRQAAADSVTKDPMLTLDGSATGAGVREWLDSLGEVDLAAAAFDTRMHGPAVVTGRASTSISKRLRKHGMREVLPPESFFVTKQNRLEPGEELRARSWGEELAARQP